MKTTKSIVKVCLCIVVITLVLEKLYSHSTIFNIVPGRNDVVTYRPAIEDTQPTSKMDGKFVHGKGSVCMKLPIPDMNQNKSMWQPVSVSNSLFLYSAHVDNDKIRLIGIRTNTVAPLICQIWNRDVTLNTVSVELRSAKMEKISGGENGQSYTTTYVNCPLISSSDTYAVAIAEGNLTCKVPMNMFLLYRPVITTQRNISVCVPPVHGNYPTTQNLVQWLETNRMLGAQFFTFYNHSIKKNTSLEKVFEKYTNAGIIEILQWNLPTKDIHYAGQIASMHDCLYRNRKRFKYTGFFDLDELIIPRKPEDLTWADLLNKLPEGCSYSFQSSFFKGNKTDVSHKSLDKALILNNSFVMKGLKRESRIFRHGDRSKVLVKPEEIKTFGVHITWSCRDGKVIRHVDPAVGMLHHYRMGKTIGEVDDNTTLKYMAGLRQQLDKSPIT